MIFSLLFWLVQSLYHTYVFTFQKRPYVLPHGDFYSDADILFRRCGLFDISHARFLWMESDLRPALLIKGVPRPQVKWKVLEK